MSFNKILNKYRKISFSERDKGTRFERLMQAYLKTDPKYAYLFKKVMLWSEFPGRKDLGGGDTGIDLVAQTYAGDYWAIQCKCYQETALIDKPTVDTFLSTSGREFKDENMQTTRFSHRLWISTTNRWGPNATEAIKNQSPPVTRLNLSQLKEAPVDWEKLEKGIHGEESRLSKKLILSHQKEALERTHEYFKTSERGKLIMACGTGKTFISLRIAEKETNGKGFILFLVPSIALLGQVLREWTADANEPINAICVCSDPKVSQKKKKEEDKDIYSVVDLALPATTNATHVLNYLRQYRTKRKSGLTVVFSTYQSIDVVSRAQKLLMKEGFGEFDLIVCDEAHRTTGVTLSGEDESAFVKVHDNNFIKGRKRLYMTATPRLYSDDIKSKAAQADAILCSMDDPALYGDEIYRIGFGEAVERDLLTDYKVLILTLNENDVPPAIQRMISDRSSEINTDDATKLIGTINALSKQVLGDEGIIKSVDPEPMNRAVAFCQRISVSKKITGIYNSATDAYINSLPGEKREKMVAVTSRHIDGTMTAPERDELMGWLKSEEDNNECKILTNVRCLSEGVDVPSLDAVMFLSARNSQVDVVQSVGRVMRKSPGKKYGYIIIPVVVPTDVEADKALDDNERYKVVWTVLNALRAHDDRFNATINKIELNRKKPPNILVGRPEYSWENGNPVELNPDNDTQTTRAISQQLALQFEQLQNVVFARMVLKVGDRRYWEQWAKSVAEIAQRHEDRIKRLIQESDNYKDAFEKFLFGLQKNINPNITQKEAIEMLSQHLITAPVFEALFEDYSFVRNNPISIAMQNMLDLLEEQALEKDTKSLEKFYESVKKRAEGIDNSEGKQRIIIELYEKYFKTALPKMVERLGIVYTPTEVVDFIIHSVNVILKKEFGRNISDEDIHVLDPFTGTGTFITRLLQSDLIDKKDISRKYNQELHANEIVLLAYYIAAVNIENAYHDVVGNSKYTPFNGICLTDSFQLGESDESSEFFSEFFPKNSERVAAQKEVPIRVIIGNPPYSIGQKSFNDNAQNQKYDQLDARIANTYVSESSAGLNKSLYDLYIKAYRWSTDRLNNTNGGIICFISNASWIDGNSQEGFRKCLEKEFSSIWVLNMRGNARTKGEKRRKEAGNVFGEGSRAPIAITLLVRNPKVKKEKADIYYYDIGDYLSRKDKLSILNKYGSINNSDIKWVTLKPNKYGDWLTQRTEVFYSYISIAPEKKLDLLSHSFFVVNGPGISTGRDSWVYNYSFNGVSRNMRNMIIFYNDHVQQLSSNNSNRPDSLDSKPTEISWTVNLRKAAQKLIKYKYSDDYIIVGHYRPFNKQYLYFHKPLIERPGINPILFPNKNLTNLIICVSSAGTATGMSVLISNSVTDYHYNGDTKVFPLYYYEENQKAEPTLFDSSGKTEYLRRDGISDFSLKRAKELYGKNVNKEDIFYYVYGILHSEEYRTAYADDLKRTLPRIPMIDVVKDFWKISKAGRELADLHVNYENVEPHPNVKVNGAEKEYFIVDNMRFPQKGQKDTIIYNSKITVSNIPITAYEYVINGKPAIEWVMERYQVKVDKACGIKNDPNDWAKEVGNPRYILDLLLSIINVSVQTVEIVKGLPKLEFE